MGGCMDMEFLERTVCERIAMLISGKSDEQGMKTMEEAEAIIAGLGQAEKEKLEAYLEMIVDQQAVSEKKIYWGGFMDGLQSAGYIYLEGIAGRCQMCGWIRNRKISNSEQTRSDRKK